MSVDTTLPEGGPAFPVNWDHGGGLIQSFSGMTLRDFFAAKAMQGFCVDENYSFDKAAEYAYKQADAMLKERSK